MKKNLITKTLILACGLSMLFSFNAKDIKAVEHASVEELQSAKTKIWVTETRTYYNTNYSDVPTTISEVRYVNGYVYKGVLGNRKDITGAGAGKLMFEYSGYLYRDDTVEINSLKGDI